MFKKNDELKVTKLNLPHENSPYYNLLNQIPLVDILHCKVNTRHGSFDVIVQTKTDEYGIHCFIQDEWNKKREFIELMERKGVSVRTMTSMSSL